MEKIYLRPMDQNDYDRWLPESKAEYAEEKERSGLSAADAQAEAEKSFSTLLPDGPRTSGQFMFSVVEKTSERVIGCFWWGLQKQGSEMKPWVYDVKLHEAHRGKGYGRATMIAGEATVRAEGYTTLGLHVFGHNSVARKLYESLDFVTTNVVMRKDL